MNRSIRQSKEAGDKDLLLHSFFDDNLFRWRRPPEGQNYRWVWAHGLGKNYQAEKERMRFLTDGRIVGQPYSYREYWPLRTKRQMFLEFAETETTEEGIMKFADEWGMLGMERIIRTESDRLVVWGYEYLAWKRSIHEMCRTVRFWKWATKRDVVNLSKYIEWQDEDKHQAAGWRITPFFSESVLSSDGFLSWEKYSYLQKEDLVAAAFACAQLSINEHLKQQCGVRLLQNQTRHEFCLRVLPQTLLGALWWQFARAFIGETDYRRCAVCPRILEISNEGGFRRDRAFCSDACRQKDHRAKVKRAKELKEEGLNIREIAKEFDTEPKTIRNWLTKPK